MTIQQAIQDTIQDFGQTPEEINEGNCEAFAHEVKAKVPAADVEDDDGHHYYLHLNGKYYDAEQPNGVKTPQQLPFFVKEAKRRGHMTKIVTLNLSAPMKTPTSRPFRIALQVRINHKTEYQTTRLYLNPPQSNDTPRLFQTHQQAQQDFNQRKTLATPVQNPETLKNFPKLEV